MRFFFRALRYIIEPLAGFFSKANVWLAWRHDRAEIKAIPELERLFLKFSASPEAGWSIAANDVLRLYQLVLKYRPKHILELGTGIGFSTAVMALAMKKTGDGHITSLEQEPKCVDIAEQLLDPELRLSITIVQAVPEIFSFDQVSPWIHFCGYRWTPSPGASFDFILLDGPAGWVEKGTLVSLDSGDVFRLLPYMNSGCKIYIDGRRSTVKKIQRYLGKYVRMVERDHEYALLERTDHPISSGSFLEITDSNLQEGKGRFS